MPTARLNGTDIQYADSGGDGPAVLLSHGFLMDHTMFDQQVDALAPEFRVVTWDARAFGDTAATAPFGFWDSARDALALLDHLGIGPAVLGGMSQGGFISLRAAMLAPDRVRGLVLIDSQAGLEDPANVQTYQQLEAIWVEQGPAPVQELVAAVILGPADGVIDWQPWFAKWAALDIAGLRLAFGCLIDRDDLTGRLGEISCPALILHGTDDAAIPMARAEVLRAGLAGPATLVQIEGGTHTANMTNPDQVNAAMLEFLRTLDA
jgi:3-oxoadipate enol-lactonase